MNIWEKRCEELLSSPVMKASMKRFINSVNEQIKLNTIIYPTEAQIEILNNMWRYHSHRCGNQWEEFAPQTQNVVECNND